MKKYEYKCIHLGIWRKHENLNEYGRQGWELICAWGYGIILKELVEEIGSV